MEKKKKKIFLLICTLILILLISTITTIEYKMQLIPLVYFFPKLSVLRGQNEYFWKALLLFVIKSNLCEFVFVLSFFLFSSSVVIFDFDSHAVLCSFV